ncbi:MAG TPA: DUF1571 domain-containing protein [bacterium]|nr:DUF1571 domain-containing protein [bacterium]
MTGTFRLRLSITAALIFSVASPLCAAQDERVEQVVRDAQAAYEKVSDYTATILRTERIGRIVRKEEEIFLKFRKPGSVYMKWMTSPNPGLLNAGAEVIYPSTPSSGKMIAHLGGLINLITPTVTVLPTDRMAMENNRHPVTHTGIGFVLKLFTEQRKKALSEREFSERYHGIVEIMGRQAHKIECVLPGKEKGFYCYRTMVCFDAETRLPVRIVTYDWNDELLEQYSFRDIRLNPGLPDADFDPGNKSYEF